MARRSVILLHLLVLAAVAVGCGAAAERVAVRIGTLEIQAELALTPEERSLGLGGRDSMAPDAGMLFVFSEEQVPSFWMRAMRYPLDFIWISADHRVVDVTENVPPPAPGTADAELPLYKADAPVLYTLEVNAGVVEQAGVRVGDEVSFEPDVSPEDAR